MSEIFLKTEGIVQRYQEILNELNEPSVASNPERLRKLMVEQSELQDFVDVYEEYKRLVQAKEDSIELLEIEEDEEMKEMLREEIKEAQARTTGLEEEIRILLIPKDPNDNKNVIV